MKPIQKALILDKNEYYETHLAIINCFLPTKMTPTEIKVLARFMSLEGDIANDRFGTTARKIVRAQLRLSNSGMSNYLNFLSEKGLIEGNNILPILFPDSKEQIYNFKLLMK